MKKINIRTITLSILSAVIVFIISFAVFCPNITISKLEPTGDPVYTVAPADAVQLTEGEYLPDGTIRLPDKSIKEYMALEFSADGKTSKAVQITFANTYEKDIKLIVQRTADGSFTDLSHFESGLMCGEKTTCFRLDQNNYKAIRVWFFADCQIERVDFFNTDPVAITSKLQIEGWRYIAVAAITLIVAAAVFFVDNRFDLSGKFVCKIKNKYKSVTEKITAKTILPLIGKAFLWGAVPCALATQIIYRFVLGGYVNRQNRVSCIVFLAIFIVVAIIVYERKRIATAPERTVGLLILTFGLTIVLTQPFLHVCWDNDSHYPWAIQNSFVGKAYYSEADVRIDIPAGEFMYESSNDSFENMKEYNEIGDSYVKTNDITFSAPHLPSGLTIAVSRMFGVNFHTRYMLGQAANVIGYAILCYFAIKKLKSGKIIMSIVALFPTNLFIAANYSYDWWVTGFALLGTAYFISEMQQPEKMMSTRDAIIMCASFMLMALPKQLYVILFALPLFLYKKGRTKKQIFNYYKILVIFFIITLIMFAMRSAASLGGSGDVRGGAVDPGEQLSHILADPLGYAKLLITFLKEYLSTATMPKYISSFSYMGVTNLGNITIALLCFAVLTDKDKCDKFKGSIVIRVLAVLVLIGGAALTATSMYIAFTPVGYHTVNGCQARYLMPLLSPVLLTIANPGIGVKAKNRGLYNLGILSATALVTTACISSMIIKTVI